MPIVRRGAVTVGAPSSKRLALSVLSLRAAALPCITSRLSSRLAGNWVSVLLYRRCLSCVISGFFSLSAGLEQTRTNQLSPLPRKIADELVVLSTLAPIMVSNVALPFSQQIHAVDASLGFGAIVETKVPLELAQILWLGGDRRGQSLPLDSPAKAILAALGEESDDAYLEPYQGSIGKPLMMYYDFVEFFGGAGVVSKFASSLGLTCAPPLDLSSSRYYDLHDLRLLEWCMHMLSSGRFRSCMIELRALPSALLLILVSVPMISLGATTSSMRRRSVGTLRLYVDLPFSDARFDIVAPLSLNSLDSQRCAGLTNGRLFLTMVLPRLL